MAPPVLQQPLGFGQQMGPTGPVGGFPAVPGGNPNVLGGQFFPQMLSDVVAGGGPFTGTTGQPWPFPSRIQSTAQPNPLGGNFPSEAEMGRAYSGRMMPGGESVLPGGSLTGLAAQELQFRAPALFGGGGGVGVSPRLQAEQNIGTMEQNRFGQNVSNLLDLYRQAFQPTINALGQIPSTFQGQGGPSVPSPVNPGMPLGPGNVSPGAPGTGFGMGEQYDPYNYPGSVLGTPQMDMSPVPSPTTGLPFPTGLLNQPHLETLYPFPVTNQFTMPGMGNLGADDRFRLRSRQLADQQEDLLRQGQGPNPAPTGMVQQRMPLPGWPH